MRVGRITSENIYEETQERPRMHPFQLGSALEILCCCVSDYLKKNNKKVTDSIEFYTKREDDLTRRIESCKSLIRKHPLGIVFITFSNQKMAAEFLKYYNLGCVGHLVYKIFGNNSDSSCLKCYLCKKLPKNSEIGQEYALKTEEWSAQYATSPDNIKWENISKLSATWWLRWCLINIILIIIMVFFTTPAIILEKFTEINMLVDVRTIESKLPSYIAEFVPSLLLRILAALFPVVVAWTALAELHWSRSSENRSMMTKTYSLLLLMVLILPTLGLTSINAIFDWLKNKDPNDPANSIKWQCISDNGAFFIKYVTTCSFIGTALDLLRIPELLLYLCKLLWARSSAERLAIRMQVAFEFEYGVQYAWMLTVFTMTLSFSVVCPLITCFGLVYMTFKHMVDRYNLYFAYIPTKVDKRIHKTAVTFALVAFILLQFCILFFIAIRNEDRNGIMTILHSIVIFICCLIFIGYFFFGFFKRLSPFTSTRNDETQTLEEVVNNLENNINNNPTTIDQPISTNTNTPNGLKKVASSPFLPTILHPNLSARSRNKSSKKSNKSIASRIIDITVKGEDDDEDILPVGDDLNGDGGGGKGEGEGGERPNSAINGDDIIITLNDTITKSDISPKLSPSSSSHSDQNYGTVVNTRDRGLINPNFDNDRH
jgi:calcium permeable stress-gated cation channel